jgi:nitrite reductase/ring-hydroxylating ferredoxin subunit
MSIVEEGWTRVASVAEVPQGGASAVRLGDREIALYHVEGGEFYATENVCTHEYAQLAEGWLEGYEIECPLHAGRFDVRSGKALCPPVEEDVKTYEVRVSGSEVFIKLER